MSNETPSEHPNETPQSEEDQIAAAMRLLEQTAPSEPDGPPEPDDLHESAGGFEAPEGPTSPTLDALEEHRRPSQKTVCETCPNSVWFSSPTEVKCYCRVMYLITWSNKEPNQITGCDGIFVGQEE